MNAHPTWDGRGVTIGIVDTGVDLDHPSLNTTSMGVDKIVNWVTVTEPVTSVTPTVAPATGRFLYGEVRVVTGGVVIGVAPVELRNFP